MSNANHIAQLNELSASEGVFTTAQALRMGVTRNALSRAVASGRAERLLTGAYRLASVSASETDELTAVWKLTNPSKFTWERIRAWDGVVIGGTTAAALQDMGDFWLSPYRIYTPRRINSRLPCANFGTRTIDQADVAWVSGLPVTRAERTLVDLCLDDEDPSLLEDALSDATRKGIDLVHLRDLASGLPHRRHAEQLAQLIDTAEQLEGNE